MIASFSSRIMDGWMRRTRVRDMYRDKKAHKRERYPDGMPVRALLYAREFPSLMFAAWWTWVVARIDLNHPLLSRSAPTYTRHLFEYEHLLL